MLTAGCRPRRPPARRFACQFAVHSALLAGTIHAGEPWRAGLRPSPAARARGRADLCGQAAESWATGRASARPPPLPGRRALPSDQGRAAEVT